MITSCLCPPEFTHMVWREKPPEGGWVWRNNGEVQVGWDTRKVQDIVGDYPSFSSVQSLSRVWLFVTAWIAARQASLSITNSQSLLKLMPIKSVMPSSHLILSSPSPAPNPSQHQGLFQWVNSSHEVVKVLEFQSQHQSFQWTPRTDLL